MTIRRTLGLLLAVALCASLAFAQAQQPGARQRRQGMNRGAGQNRNPNTPQASPEMQKLTSTLVGNWRVEEKHEAAGPIAAGSSTGLAVIHRGPGGLSLVENFHVRGSMGQVNGLGVFSWNPNDKVYKAYWCDNITPSGCEPSGTGKWDGNNLVFTSESNEGGKKVSVRETYSDITADSFTFTMENGEPGGQMKPFMTMKYTRSKPATATPDTAQPKP